MAASTFDFFDVINAKEINRPMLKHFWRVKFEIFLFYFFYTPIFIRPINKFEIFIYWPKGYALYYGQHDECKINAGQFNRYSETQKNWQYINVSI